MDTLPDHTQRDPTHRDTTRRNAWQAARRGLRLRCPACGKGRLLSGYLRPAESCSACGEATGDIRPDDGPAWATILLVGHVISPLFFLFATQNASTSWIVFLVITALVLGLTAVLLPRMKGMFVGLIWAMQAGEVEADQQPESF